MIVYVQYRLHPNRRTKTLGLYTDRQAAKAAAREFLKNPHPANTRVFVDGQDVTAELKPPEPEKREDKP